jgi:hypothetical protein
MPHLDHIQHKNRGPKQRVLKQQEDVEQSYIPPHRSFFFHRCFLLVKEYLNKKRLLLSRNDPYGDILCVYLFLITMITAQQQYGFRKKVKKECHIIFVLPCCSHILNVCSFIYIVNRKNNKGDQRIYVDPLCDHYCRS